MFDKSGIVAASLSRREALLSCLFLVLVVWFGSFFEFSSFSLYVDDLSFLGRSLQVTDWLREFLTGVWLYADGRPIQFGLIDATGQIISATHSFGPAYVFLFGITAASIVATWWVLSYRFSNAVALLAATILALSPLVSVRAFLNGIASPASLLFLMLASLLYVKGWRIAAYAVSVLVLLSYELTFPVFVLMPVLLAPLRSRRDIYRLIGHALLCAALLVGYTVFKDHYGGSRLQTALVGHSVLDLGLGVGLATVRSLVFGLLGSVDLPLWLDRIGASTDTIVWGLLAFFTSAILLPRLPRLAAQDRADAMQGLVILLLLTLSGYALVYFGAADGARGVLDRDSRFHSVASLPISIVSALALAWLLSAARGARSRGAAIGLAAAYLALLFAFSVSHQDEFAQETMRQRLLVTQLVMDHPVMDPQATFVLVRPSGDWRDFTSIESSDNHPFYYLLPDLFDCNGEGRRVGPTIRLLTNDGWPQLLTAGPGDTVSWPSWMWPPQPEHIGHIWAYEQAADGRLTPVRGPIMVGGRNILHEGPDAPEGGIDLRKAKRLPLFELFLGPQAAVVNAALRPALPAE